MSATTCRICGHAAFLKAGRRPPREWDYRCREGCQCTPTYCRPIRGGDATSKELNSMSDQQSADDFLSGGGAPSAKFPTPGARTEGFVTGWETMQQRDFDTSKPKFWDDGKPMMQLAITLQTTLRDPSVHDDDGLRRIFVKGQLKAALQDAMKAAGGAKLEQGAYIAVTYTHDGEPRQRGAKPPKQYRAEYTPAGPASLQQPDPAAAYNLPPAPQQAYAPAPPAAPGFTAEQLAAAQRDPAMAALLAQLQAPQAAPAAAPTAQPPF